MSLRSLSARAGTGNWEAFPQSALPDVYAAAEDWRRALAGVEKPWLCWCVHDDWCAIQQKLVLAAGWTPVVGTDGRVANPSVEPGALFVDFNQRLRLPVMWMHFPLEFIYLMTDRMAFWHSDVLPPVNVVRQIASQFDTIRPGEMVAVLSRPGIYERLRHLWKGVIRCDATRLRAIRKRRWFEVVGCSTAAASKSQFESGGGFWRHVECHPNAAASRRRTTPYYDHGIGLWNWSSRGSGKVHRLKVDVDPYHYTTKGMSRDFADGASVKGVELARTYQLETILPGLGLPMRDEARAPSVSRSECRS